MRNPGLLIFLIFLTVFSGATGQEKGYYFRHLGTNEGLSNNTVYSINEDSLGFIWVGTRSGLNRFDGHTFRIYDTRSGLKNGLINTIFRDREGRIWVGTQGGGLGLYDYSADRFITYSNVAGDTSSISHDDVQAIAQDSQGGIWTGTHEGDLDRLDVASGRFFRTRLRETAGNGSRIGRINAMVFEHDTLLWLGALDGLYRFNTVNRAVRRVEAAGKPVVSNILCIYSEHGEKLWLGTSKGILIMKKDGSEVVSLNTGNSALTGDLIQSIRPMPDGRIGIATDGGGLCFYDPMTGAITSRMSNPNSQYSLSNNSVYEIFADRYGAIWTGHYNGGLNYYSEYDWKFIPVKHEVNDLESLSDNHVRSFFQDRKGNIWIGTLGGLNFNHAGTDKFKSYTFNRNTLNSLSSNAVLSIWEDTEGSLWIGTFGGGISIFNPGKEVFRKFRHPEDLSGSLEKANIYAMVETQSNKLCIATTGGIYLLDRHSGDLRRFQVSNSKLSNNTVKVLCMDRTGIIWAGTNLGLNRFDPETGDFTVFHHSNTDPSTLSNNRILSITESKDRKLWIGTEGGGVSIFDPSSGRFTFLTTQDGLPDNVVNSVIQDDSGIFWLATNKGLVRWDPGQKKLRVYTMADGLQANEFNQNAAYKARDGRVFFGGINGFNVFMPGNLISNMNPPKVILTELFLGGKAVRPGDEQGPLERQLFLQEEIKLEYRDGFEIHFTASGVINSGKCQYSWHMKGLDEGWTDFREVHSATFSNLRPGKYTFMVRALNNDGVFSESPATLEIRILPPWYKTWWAFLVYFVVITGLLLLFIRYNISWVRVRNQLILERKEKEQLEELNQLKLGFFTNISHEFKTPLTLILGHLDNLKGTVSGRQAENLQNIEKNAKRLLALINQLLEFRKAESGLMKLHTSKGNIVLLLKGIQESFSEPAIRKGVDFRLEVRGTIPEVWYDSEKMEKIIFNLLSNAFKYVDEGGKIGISVKASETVSQSFPAGWIEIAVMDNGSGIDPDDLGHLFERFYHGKRKDGDTVITENSGIGLAFSKRLVELHHGEISVSSRPGEGTSFVVRLPVGKDHLRDEEILEAASYELRMDYQGLSGGIGESQVRKSLTAIPDENFPILLVVDDHPMICNMLAEKFRTEYQVILAANGVEGFDKARNSIPDIIISDILMPEMDGIVFCRKIKEDPLTCHIPVVLLTAHSGDDTQLRGLKTGADAYIAKPYNPEILQATVENLIVSRKMLRSRFEKGENFTPSELVSNKLDEQLLTRLISLIENESDDDSVDITRLCREVAMSRSVLYRKLKALTGNSIQDFVRMVKLRKASRLLHDPSLTIADIAFQAGFTNTKHFSTAFRKQFGKTPTEYRNAGRQVS